MDFVIMQKGEPMSDTEMQKGKKMDETYAQGTPTRTLRVGNDLVRIVQEVHITKESIDEIADTIIEKLNLPSAQPEHRWIPCVYGNEPKANDECWISTSAKYVRRASYAPKANNQPNGFIVTDGDFGFYEYGKSAKAWMPYTKEPEPYMGEGE